MQGRGNILHLGFKELRSLWRDKVLLLFVFFAFTGLIYVVSSATSIELNNAPIAVVDEDQSHLSNRIISAFFAPYFKTPDIIALSDENDSNQDGISGRPNRVWNVETKQTELGRFGLKANKPTLEMIVAGAFANDLGITNSLESNQPCTDLQPTCLGMPNGNDEEDVELPDHLLKLVVNFNRNLAPVKRRKPNNQEVLAGRDLFYQSGCHQCHNPSFTTQKSSEFPHLSKQVIWPYSDFLLHDMGPDLADGRSDFLATGNEWRTPPLWGIGLLSQVNGMSTLLHDGRARTVEEAIVWHGGEAEPAKNRFIHLAKEDRDRLIQFVNSL